MVNNFPGGISVFDKNLRMVYCNEQQKKLLEYPDDLFAGGYPTLEDLYRLNATRGEYGPGDVEEHVSVRMELAREQRPHVFERTRPNGTVLEIRGVPLEGGGFVTTYLDVTEQRKTQAMVAHMAHHDSLTDLPNRVLFRDRLDQALARVRRGEQIALHYLDLDRFKPVNDEHGHAVGDQLLRAVAGRLSRIKRDTDTIARLGGDEFVFIQTAITSRADATAFAWRVHNGVCMPFSVAGRMISVGTSIGIAQAPDHGLDPDELLKQADAALYRCKGRRRLRLRGIAALSRRHSDGADPETKTGTVTGLTPASVDGERGLAAAVDRKRRLPGFWRRGQFAGRRAVRHGRGRHSLTVEAKGVDQRLRAHQKAGGICVIPAVCVAGRPAASPGRPRPGCVGVLAGHQVAAGEGEVVYRPHGRHTYMDLLHDHAGWAGKIDDGSRAETSKDAAPDRLCKGAPLWEVVGIPDWLKVAQGSASPGSQI